MTTSNTYPIHLTRFSVQIENPIFPSNDNNTTFFGGAPVQFDEIFQIFCETDFFRFFCCIYEVVKRMMQNTTSIE